MVRTFKRGTRWLAGAHGHTQAGSKISQSIPNWRRAARRVPSLRSFAPQSGKTDALPVAGLNHLRWDRPFRRGSSWQLRRWSFLAASRYFMDA